jgi:hypothetical protein
MELNRNLRTGYCLVCRDSIFFDDKFKNIYCIKCLEKNSNRNLEGSFCHYCGRSTLVSKYKPICNGCSYVMESKYKKALENNPSSSKIWSDLGDVLRFQNKYEEAEGAYRKAIDIDPENLSARTNLGITLVCQKGGSGG